MLLLLYFFTSFPSRKDDIFKNEGDHDSIFVEASGSIGQYRNGKCVLTNPNETLSSDDRNTDWCSNIAGKNENSWITYAIKGKMMKISGFSIRSGCCYSDCCCTDNGSDIYCCCDLYTITVHGSNDNKTWNQLHKIVKDNNFPACTTKTYEVKGAEYYKFIRFTNDEQYPGCPNCMALNQVALYGKVQNSGSSFYDSDDSDEAVSIIGKVRRPIEN